MLVIPLPRSLKDTSCCMFDQCLLLRKLLAHSWLHSWDCLVLLHLPGLHTHLWSHLPSFCSMLPSYACQYTSTGFL